MAFTRAKNSSLTVLNKYDNALAGLPGKMAAPTATNVGTSRPFNNGSASVAFTALPPTAGIAITSYTVTSSPGGFTATGASSPLVVTGLQSGTSYTFTVVGTNVNGLGAASDASNSITATTVPQAPTIGTPTCATGQAFTGSASISVPFTANATGGAAISSFTVTSSSTATASGGSSPVAISQTVGSSYTYTVTATNANGTSTASGTSASVLAASVPQAPTIGTATGGNATATVTYTAGATGGSAITTFTATSSPGSLTGTGASPITVSGLSNGTAYTFTITATNAFGTSAASAASNSVTPVDPPVTVFVAAADTATANLSSTNGINFTARTTPWPSARGIAYSGTRWAAVRGPESLATTAMYSDNAITWTTTTTPNNGRFYSLAFGAGRFAAYNQSTTNVMTSTDGITWSFTTGVDASEVDDVVFGSSLFVTIANFGQKVMTSPNGTTWTSRDALINYFGSRIAFGGGNFVTVRINSRHVNYSTSPTSSWSFTLGPNISPLAWTDIMYGNGLFVAIASGTSDYGTTPTGATWTTRTLPSSSSWGAGVYSTANGLFTIFGSSTVAATSSDGIAWTLRTVPSISPTAIASSG